ncbi:MAG: apolipoprotein N-acyltransferase [Gammaproteobacteria bacterium]
MNIFTAPRVGGRWAAAGLGLLLPIAFAPFNWFWLAPLSLGGLFLLWVGQDAREAALRSFCFGFSAFAFGTYWLFISLKLLGGAPLPVVLVMMAGLVLSMALYLAGCAWLSNRIAPTEGAVRWLLVVPAAWTLVEWLRSWLFSGFPWLSIGYSQIDTPLAAWAPVAGIYAVSWITVVLAGLIPWAIYGSRVTRAAAAAILAVVLILSALLRTVAWTAPGSEELKVAMIQGAIPQVLKWLPSQRLPTLRTYAGMSLDLEAQDLIIWPEAAIPAVPEQVRPFLDAMTEQMVELDTQLLTGILSYDVEHDQYRNTLLALGDPPGDYYKRHLVPFGEYFPVPGFVREWMRLVNLPYETTTAGPADQRPLMVKNVAIAPSICYEVAFGAEQLVFLPGAGLLVNVSNDAWFGDSIAPHQHLQMARMRALEAGRPMLRATNTGITALITPDGNVQATIPQFEPGVLTGVVRPHTGTTPYVRTGNWPIAAATLLILVLVAGIGRRRRR